MTTVYYKKTNANHDFFMSVDGKEYYLFTQQQRKGVGDFYKGKVMLDRAIRHGIGKKDRAIHRTMDKLVMYIKYVEKENGIQVLKKTHKKAA